MLLIDFCIMLNIDIRNEVAISKIIQLIILQKRATLLKVFLTQRYKKKQEKEKQRRRTLHLLCSNGDEKILFVSRTSGRKPEAIYFVASKISFLAEK
jgi:hypothetical protein